MCHGATAARLYFSVLAGRGQVGTVHGCLEVTPQGRPGHWTGKVLQQELG